MQMQTVHLMGRSVADIFELKSFENKLRSQQFLKILNRFESSLLNLKTYNFIAL